MTKVLVLSQCLTSLMCSGVDLPGYSYSEKCPVTLGMCLVKGTQSEHLLWSRQVLLSHLGF